MFYAVAYGKNPGIYNTWEEVKPLVNGYPNAKYKKFSTKPEAFAYIEQIRSQLAFERESHDVLRSIAGKSIL